MKKLIVILLVLLFCSTAMGAENLVDLRGKLGDWGFSFRSKTGMIYSMQREESQWEVCTMLEIWKKYGLSISGGYAYETEGIAALQYDFSTLMPVDRIPLVSPEVGIYAGYDIEREEVDFGMVFTIVNIDF